MRGQRRLSVFVLLLTGCLLLSQGDPGLAQAGNDQLLLWIAPGVLPEDSSARSPGALVLMGLDGSQTPLLELPEGTEVAMPCGDDATAPDGTQFVFYVGGDTGTLYLMTRALPQLQVLAEGLSRMTCAGSGTFRFSADSSRLAYLDYPAGFNTDTTAIARLVITDTRTYVPLLELADVAAYDLTATGAVYLNLFRNDRGEPTEVAAGIWDGSTTREIAFQTAESGCLYTSAGVVALPDERQAALLGYRCTGGAGRTVWQFYLIDPANRSMTLVTSNVSPGRFVPYARTGMVYLAPSGSDVFFTVPDGVTAFTTSLNRVQMTAMGVTPVAQSGNLVMAQLNSRVCGTANHLPLLSPDRRLLAMVGSSANDEASLFVLDMATPELPPIVLPVGERGSEVRELLFSPDSNRLYFVAGGDASHLSVLDTITGLDNRLSRGQYLQGVLAPDATQMALVRYETLTEREPPYATLVLLDLNSGSETILFQGAVIVENRVTESRFVCPLAWRRG
ncbi:MAG: hypothetical protein MUE40_05020 [Anaerolineae bacterium]|jgi:hypothetical protein|nr:hypothetical protein [Anaerolineae bacterium]